MYMMTTNAICSGFVGSHGAGVRFKDPCRNLAAEPGNATRLCSRELLSVTIRFSANSPLHLLRDA